MLMLCILLVASGACIMLYSLAKYYKSLAHLRMQINAQKLFSDWIYVACFAMMIFFLIGYVANLAFYAFGKKISSQDLLIALIFFFGAVFVLAMNAMIHRIFNAITDKAELKKRLEQQELMSAIAKRFTTTDDPRKLVCEALEMSGRFMNVNHAFLSQYKKEGEFLQCLYEWYDEKAMPFIGGQDRWPLTGDMQFFDDLINKGYSAISNYKLLTHPNFSTVKDYNLGAFLNIPIDVDGEFWGVLGFIIYGKTYEWSKSNINLGKLIAGIFSGAIGRHIAEEEIIEARKIAERESKSKSEFLSRMSHEMRTPMNAIIGMTNIGKASPDIDRKDYCFEKIEAASTHLLGVINDVLDMSKIEADKLELSYTVFSLERMLAKIINVVGYKMEEKKQRFILSIDRNVPEAVESDEQRLSQVMTNLLSNAVKFTPDGGAISVFVRKLNEENGICTLQFEVKDTGIGISEEQQANLFKSFEQADGSISRKYGGTGLGLAISKRIVEMMEGSIRAESAPEQGSSFIFDIRARIAPLPAAEDKAAKTSQKPAVNHFKDRKILVAEDIEINREIVAALLKPAGVSIDFAENGRTAYEMFTANPQAYSMIFMDIHMPEVDGYEATRMIRALAAPNAKTMPIIAMTADVFREDIEKCLAAGMDDHIGKPLNATEIMEKLAKYMPGESVK